MNNYLYEQEIGLQHCSCDPCGRPFVLKAGTSPAATDFFDFIDIMYDPIDAVNQFIHGIKCVFLIAAISYFEKREITNFKSPRASSDCIRAELVVPPCNPTTQGKQINPIPCKQLRGMANKYQITKINTSQEKYRSVFYRFSGEYYG